MTSPCQANPPSPGGGSSRRHLLRRWLRGLLVAALGLAAAQLPAGEARWWKGNLHTHTLWSDGDDFPEMIAESYRERGYHFLALSDHNLLSRGERWISLKAVADRAKGEPWRAGIRPRDAFAAYLRRHGPDWVQTRTNPTNGTREVRLKPYDEFRALVEERGRFLLIESEELTQETSQRRQIHLGAINLHEALPAIRGATVPEILQKALDQVAEAGRRSGRPTLLHVNHPNYKWGVTAEDLAAVVGERFFEVWNGVDGDNDPGDALHPSTDQIWDIANTLRLAGLGAPPLQAVASDDSHDYQGNERHSPPFRAWIQVRARHLTPESLIRAIERGDFYASTGVVLEDVAFDADARRLSLRIHARPGERLTTRFLGTRRGVSLAGRPRLDAAGKVLETTLDYRSGTGPQIGEVLAEVTGPRPSYRMRGDELYVRAVVTSSRAPEVPTTEAEFQQAWTQPVGWKPAVSPQP
ncbi:MAG: hypothetical protein LW626_09000 [Verrucomicrobium sp.]|nr:hypothetical protein [Verrucomicrobium sp.]